MQTDQHGKRPPWHKLRGRISDAVLKNCLDGCPESSAHCCRFWALQRVSAGTASHMALSDESCGARPARQAPTRLPSERPRGRLRQRLPAQTKWGQQLWPSTWPQKPQPSRCRLLRHHRQSPSRYAISGILMCDSPSTSQKHQSLTGLPGCPFPPDELADIRPVIPDSYLLPLPLLAACPVPCRTICAENIATLSRLLLSIVTGQVYTPATAGVLDGAAFSTFLTNQYAAKSTTGDSLSAGQHVLHNVQPANHEQLCCRLNPRTP